MALKAYVKIILVVAVFALWIAMAQISKMTDTESSGGCSSCGGGHSTTNH